MGSHGLEDSFSAGCILADRGLLRRRQQDRVRPHRKLRRKVPRVDGALTTQPRTPTVPPARSASASSMQSPPASAEATSVSILSPVFAPSRRAAEVKVMVDEFPQAQVPGEGGRQEQAGIGHRPRKASPRRRQGRRRLRLPNLLPSSLERPDSRDRGSMAAHWSGLGPTPPPWTPT